MWNILNWLFGTKKEEIAIEPKENIEQPLASSFWMASDEYACNLDPVVFKEELNETEVLKPIGVVAVQNEEIKPIAMKTVSQKMPKKTAPKKKTGIKISTSAKKPARKAPIKKA